MRKSVFIAGLVAALAVGMGIFGTGRKGSVTQAQQNTSTKDQTAVHEGEVFLFR
jgi:hypothetical protein